MSTVATKKNLMDARDKTIAGLAPEGALFGNKHLRHMNRTAG